jgi:hypothetical protein
MIARRMYASVSLTLAAAVRAGVFRSSELTADPTARTKHFALSFDMEGERVDNPTSKAYRKYQVPAGLRATD